MTDNENRLMVDQLVAVLREAFDGPPTPWSYFTDHGADAGLLGTLAKVSAAEASRPVAGTTIAAHVHHIVFGLEASSAWIRGDRNQRNWKDSWSVSAVDDATWTKMLDQLRSGYDDLKQAIEAFAPSSAEAAGGSIGAVAHLAYHLGAIKQKVGMSRKADQI